MELSGLESADIIEKISVIATRFRMVWDHVGWFRSYDGRVLVALFEAAIPISPSKANEVDVQRSEFNRERILRRAAGPAGHQSQYLYCLDSFMRHGADPRDHRKHWSHLRTGTENIDSALAKKGAHSASRLSIRFRARLLPVFIPFFLISRVLSPESNF